MKKFFLTLILLATALTSQARTLESKISEESTSVKSCKLPAMAQEFVANLGSTVITTLTDKSKSSKQKEEDLTKLFEGSVASDAIGKFALGRKYWFRVKEKGLEDAFLNINKRYLTRTYIHRLGNNYKGQILKVKGYRPESDKKVTILSEILYDGETTPITVDWRVVQLKDGTLKIIDLIIGGVSWGVTLRDEYSAILGKNRGDVQSLINHIEEIVKNAKPLKLSGSS